MRRIIRDKSLLLALFGLFLLFITGESIAGFYDYNEDQQQRHQPRISYFQYLGNAHFYEATLENWESEYLEMGLLVILTAFLIAKGSAESRTQEDKEQEKQEEEQLERDEQQAAQAQASARQRQDVPGPVKRGGWILKLYENSLGIALLALFLLCFFLHAATGAREYSHEQAFFGQPPLSTLQYIATAHFWFQSFQNWQSEFLGVATLSVLSIYLRQRGSSESKRATPPTAPPARNSSLFPDLTICSVYVG